jgi:hypothetical protein
VDCSTRTWPAERGQHGDGDCDDAPGELNGTKHDHWLPGTGPDVMIMALTGPFGLERATGIQPLMISLEGVRRTAVVSAGLRIWAPDGDRD